MTIFGRSGSEDGIDRWRLVPWPRVLVWIMRLLSIVWLVKGLLGWAAILEVPGVPVTPFQDQDMAQRMVTVSFAVVDLVAAVGLWLTTSWGGVMWLFAVMSALIAKLLVPTGVVVEATEIVVSGLLVAAYLAISWLAARDPPSV
jgi:fatty acid desaturase